MRRLEVRRHSIAKSGSARGDGSYLTTEGVALARRAGEAMGPFDVVVASPFPRTTETAIAMGFAVDDVVDVGIGEVFWKEVGRYDRTGPDTFAAYRAIVDANAIVARVGAAQRQVWTAVLETLGSDGAALFISHGEGIEAGLVTCFEELEWTDGSFKQCEGFRCAYVDGEFRDAEIVRL